MKTKKNKDSKNLRTENIQLKKLIAKKDEELKLCAENFAKIELYNKRKLEFITYLSHEFKTPLNAINGFTFLMYEKELPRERQIKYLNNILNASKHLTQILEYTIEMTRAESDKIKLYYEQFKPSEIIIEVVAVLEEKISQKHILLSQNLTDTAIVADKRRFKQLIYNLVGNALKYNKIGGEIQINTYYKENNFYFKIKDTGEGIHPDEQSKIFELFCHTNHNKSKHKNSSGIGLSLCKKIINLHGGNINFCSEPQKGSVFWFNLPCKKLSQNTICEKLI